MKVSCIKCQRYRSAAYMQQAVFRGVMVDEPVDLWRCASGVSCRSARKPCPKCGHMRHMHGKEFHLSDITVYECGVSMGMGDWCGCKEQF